MYENGCLQPLRTKDSTMTQDVARSRLQGFVSLFRRKTKDTPRPPAPGEEWRLIANGDPFPPKITHKIREVRDGWVRYAVGSGSLFDDERMPVDRFVRIFCYHSGPPTVSGPEAALEVRAVPIPACVQDSIAKAIRNTVG